MDKTGILFPHQLFEQNPLALTCNIIYLVEEKLFFKQYNFHKRKIAFHRASMKAYENYLQAKSIKVIYINAFDEIADIRKLIPYLKTQGIDNFEYIETTDSWLEKRIKTLANSYEIKAKKTSTPMFLNSTEELIAFFTEKKKNVSGRLLQTSKTKT